MTTPTEAAARGAAWLDERKPDWYRDIDLGRLDLSNECRCILGQIGGHYSDVLGWLFGTDWPWERALTDNLGFSAYSETEVEYAALDEAWIAEVKARWEHAGFEREGAG